MEILDKVQNIVAKGEITVYEQVLLLPQSFQHTSSADASKCVCKLERINQICIQWYYYNVQRIICFARTSF